MNIKNYSNILTGIAFTVFFLISCVQKDEWETPPVNCRNRFADTTITLSDFRAQAPAAGYILIEEDQIFEGYVTSSDESGNFYKTISFQDKPENPTAALQIEVDRANNYADFPVGAHIKINAKGLRLGTDRGVVKIGSADPVYDIGRIPGILLNRYISGVCDGNKLEIAVIKPLELATLKSAHDEKYINMLVKVRDVQFATGEIGKKYLNYNAGAGVDTDRNIVDQSGNASRIRNSGFARFGSDLLPEGKGSLTFVVSRYNVNWRMLIRNLNDIEFSGKRFFFDGFEGSLTDHWIPVNVKGNQVWNIQQFGNPKPCAVMNGFASGNNLNEDWLISKPVSLQGFSSATLSFETDVRYNGHPLEVFITENYTGNPSTTVWIPLSAILDPNSEQFNTWTYSGDISLNNFLNKEIQIAFRYASTPAAAATWELDNVKVVGS
nr:DUF5689 domain-containing protein [uncultured Chryseobacterium sp.]